MLMVPGQGLCLQEAAVVCLLSGDLSQGPTLPSHKVGHVTWVWQIREPRLHIHSDWSE